jgi:hypothetical protein
MSDVRVQVTWVNPVWDRYLVVSGDNEREISLIRDQIGQLPELSELSSSYLGPLFVQAGRPLYVSFTLQLFGPRVIIESIARQAERLVHEQPRRSDA